MGHLNRTEPTNIFSNTWAFYTIYRDHCEKGLIDLYSLHLWPCSHLTTVVYVADTNLWPLQGLWRRSSFGGQLKTPRRHRSSQLPSDLHTSPSMSGRLLEEPRSSLTGPQWSWEGKKRKWKNRKSNFFCYWLHVFYLVTVLFFYSTNKAM